MRKASSLLELVIAIVVMGIAVMTLPLMLTTTQSNNTFAIQQEAILAARTQLGDMLTYLWDENSDSNGTIAVLDTNSTNTCFQRYNNTIRRVGHIVGNKRRKYFSSKTYATTPSHLGMDINDNNIPDDIDDFNTASTNITPDGKLDYKFDFSITTKVSYITDNYTPSNNNIFDFSTTPYTANSTNIKMTTINLTSNRNKDLNITLRAYSCNIGANQLLRRDF